MKRLFNLFLGSAAGRQLLTWLERIEPERPNLLRVLTYHRVEAAATFDEQMQYLSANYEVVSMPRVLAAVRGRATLPPRAVAVTFDDAYQNFAECAWPILKRYSLAVTLFVPTAFPDNPSLVFWWEWLEHGFQHTHRRHTIESPAGRLPLATSKQRAAGQRRLRRHLQGLPDSEALAWTYQICQQLDVPRPPSSVMGWQELRRLAAEGVTLGAHSQTHRLLTHLSPEEVKAEAAGSLGDLEREIGASWPIFAYPGGWFNDSVGQILKRAHVALAFTTMRGTNVLGEADPLRLRRINIGPRATLPALRARLVHASVYLNRWRPVTAPAFTTAFSHLEEV